MTDLYGVRVAGRTITDPEWRGPDDVMRSAHGHGVTRMPGALVRLSGWCSPGPVGSRPRHDRCRSDRCECECHDQTGAVARQIMEGDADGA